MSQYEYHIEKKDVIIKENAVYEIESVCPSCGRTATGRHKKNIFSHYDITYSQTEYECGNCGTSWCGNCYDSNGEYVTAGQVRRAIRMKRVGEYAPVLAVFAVVMMLGIAVFMNRGTVSVWMDNVCTALQNAMEENEERTAEQTVQNEKELPENKETSDKSKETDTEDLLILNFLPYIKNLTMLAGIMLLIASVYELCVSFRNEDTDGYTRSTLRITLSVLLMLTPTIISLLIKI